MSLTDLIHTGIATFTSHEFLVAASCMGISYVICNAVYQLYFSPLSAFPGPKIAAITLWYEIYYDVFKWGRYYTQVQKMHEKYGPIVRINPFELHVSDPEFIDTLYTRSAPRDKHAYMTRAFGNDDVTFCTTGHALHRVRRAAVAPFFSKQRVAGLQTLIWTHIEKLCARLDEYKREGRPVPVRDMFGCLTADIIIEYAMGVKQNALDERDFAPYFARAIREFGQYAVVLKHAPWMHKVLRAVPPAWMASVSPEMNASLEFRRMNDRRVREAFERAEEKRGEDNGQGNSSTIFDDLIAGNLAPQEKTPERLSDESQIIIGAALDTTAYTLTVTLFHLLSNPDVLGKLQRELAHAVPDPMAHTPLPELERLPYFSAAINEGLRLSYGLASRNARIAPTPLRYKDYAIPAFTAVGMTAWLTHHDESIFPDSHSFVPERWLSSDGKRLEGMTPDGRPLERYLMAFGRGARMCLGMNLARAELYMCLATLLTRYKMELHDCSREDVVMARDLFLPGTEKEGTGVKVMVL
ncbi:hypothetical protein E8E13_002120 [Curvularia kusanoi]|uniref:Cytochrome P450 n=1 Tax=Curvularia kusanoi TaxID=90978 RepID=A0A9P4W7W7_CURKU|nr:hypothetical protein E8E13_002120 [Curvularia kusanoi]